MEDAAKLMTGLNLEWSSLIEGEWRCLRFWNVSIGFALRQSFGGSLHPSSRPMGSLPRPHHPESRSPSQRYEISMEQGTPVHRITTLTPSTELVVWLLPCP